MTDDRQARIAALEELVKLTQLDDAERQLHRRQLLDDLDRLEVAIQAQITDPGPLIRAGKVVTGEDGLPVPDLKARRQAEQGLEQLHRERARLLGDSGSTGA